MTVWQIIFSGASVQSKRIVVYYELSQYQTPRKYIQQMHLYLRKKKAFKKRYSLAKIFRSAVAWQQQNILETAYVKHRATLCQSLCHCYSLFIAPLSKLHCLHTLTFWRNTEIFKCEVSDYSDFKRNVQTWSTYLFGLNDFSTTWDRHLMRMLSWDYKNKSYRMWGYCIIPQSDCLSLLSINITNWTTIKFYTTNTTEAKG